MRMRICLTILLMLVSIPCAFAEYDQESAFSALRQGEGWKLVHPVQIDLIEAKTEMEALTKVYQYIAKRYKFIEDRKRIGRGESWTPANEMIERLTGDCEDWAILMVSMLRFNTTKPIPAERVWVMCNYEVRHAWALYQDEDGNFYTINPSPFSKPQIYLGKLFHPDLIFNDKIATATSTLGFDMLGIEK